DAHAFAGRFVADVRDAFDLFGLHQFGNAFNQLGLVDLVRNFSDHDVFAVFADFFDGGFGAHHEAATARLVSGLNALAAGDVRAGRKIRAGHDPHDFFQRRVWLVEQNHRGFHDLAQIVRRNVRGHAYGDAAGAIHQQIRNARRQHEWLFACLVKIGNEINGFFFEVGENIFADLRQTRFRVPHGRRRIAIDGAEISLSIDQRVTHVEVLREADERGIDDGFTVRMVVAGSVAADLRAFAVAAVGGKAEVVHGHENAPLHGLEAVAHVGQRARDDYAHRVVEIRLLHLGFDIDREQYRLVCLVRHFPSLWLSFYAVGARYIVPYEQSLSFPRVLQCVSLHCVEGVRCVRKTPGTKVLFRLLQKAVALEITRKFDRYASLAVRRMRRRRAKFADAQSAQPGQSRPTQLPHHVADFSFGRNR